LGETNIFCHTEEYLTVYCVVSALKESYVKDTAEEQMLTKHDRQSYIKQRQVNLQPGMTSIQSVQPDDVLNHFKHEEVSSDEVDTKFQFQRPVEHCQSPVSESVNHFDSIQDHSSADARLLISHSGVVPVVVGVVISHIDKVQPMVLCLSDHLYAKQHVEEPHFTSIGSFDGPGVERLETSVSLKNIKEESDSLYDSDCTESVTSSMFTEFSEDEKVPIVSEIEYISSGTDANDWTSGSDRQHTRQCSDAFCRKKILVAVTSKLLQRSVVELKRLDISKLVLNILFQSLHL